MRRGAAVLLAVMAMGAALAGAVAPAAAQRAERPAPAAAKKGVAAQKPAGKKPRAAAPLTPPPAPAAEAPPPPYDGQLARLAEVMGALAFLRDLCNAGDGDDWRDKMAALVDADAPGGTRREKLVGAFNRGFRSFELTYRVCTPNAEAAVARYLKEAAELTGDLTYRYGSP